MPYLFLPSLPVYTSENGDTWNLLVDDNGNITSHLLTTRVNFSSVRHAAWKVLTPIDSDFSIDSTWDVYQIEELTSVNISWHTDSDFVKVYVFFNTVWKTTEHVDTSIASTWNVLTPVYRGRYLSWQILTDVDVFEDVTWDQLETLDFSIDGGTWGTSENLNISMDFAWDVLTDVDISINSSWGIFEIVNTSVGTTEAATWNALQIISTSLVATWNTLTTTAKTSISTWLIKSMVSNTSMSVWVIRTSVVKFSISTWTVLRSLTDAHQSMVLGIYWNVMALPIGTTLIRVMKSGVTGYQSGVNGDNPYIEITISGLPDGTFQAIYYDTNGGSHGSGSYDSLGGVWPYADTAVIIFNLVTTTGTSYAFTPVIRDSSSGLIIGSASTSNAVTFLGTVSNTYASTWLTKSTVSKTSISAWTVRTPIVKTSISAWVVKARVTQTCVNTWTVKARITQTDVSTWAVKAKIAKTSISTWVAKKTVAQTFDSTWQIQSNALDSTSSITSADGSIFAGMGNDGTIGPATLESVATWSDYNFDSFQGKFAIDDPSQSYRLLHMHDMDNNHSVSFWIESGNLEFFADGTNNYTIGTYDSIAHAYLKFVNSNGIVTAYVGPDTNSFSYQWQVTGPPGWTNCQIEINAGYGSGTITVSHLNGA